MNKIDKEFIWLLVFVIICCLAIITGVILSEAKAYEPWTDEHCYRHESGHYTISRPENCHDQLS